MASTVLDIQNPWWKDPTAIDRDTHLSTLEGKSYFFSNPLVTELSLEPGRFHIIRGPRQVGKTTLMKQLIRRLISSGNVSEQNIFFLSCETIKEYSELQETLFNWLPQTNKKACCLLLDEISFVSEWQRAILSCFNSGLLANCCLIVTGSNARDLKKSSERFPGRRGAGKDISLFPLSPLEFGKLKCFSNLSNLDLLLTYMKIGGFPHAIRDFVKHGYVTDETYKTYRNWIIGDAARYNLAEETLKHILFRISQTVGSRLTWPALIENTPIKSHETALSYVEHLEDSFLCKIHYCYSEKQEAPAIKKARKLYFIDPLLYDLALAWKNGIENIWSYVDKRCQKSEQQGLMLESSYVCCLARYIEPIFYWYSTKHKKEVDIVFCEQGEFKLYDCKWTDKARYRALGKAVDILTPNHFVDFIGDTAKISQNN